jgi:hypothetical protein
MDRVGRKPLMLLGVGGCCVCLIIEAAIVATYAEEATNKAALAAGVAMSVFAATLHARMCLLRPEQVLPLSRSLQHGRRRRRRRLLL